MVGGNVGPELTRVGSKVKPEWLADWLRNPKVYDPDTAMPHFRFEEKDIGLAIGFLQSKTDSDFLPAFAWMPPHPRKSLMPPWNQYLSQSLIKLSLKNTMCLSKKM